MDTRKVLALAITSATIISGCNTNPPDPIGQPYIVSLNAKQESPNSELTRLTALVAFGGFGAVQSTVEFLDGNTVLASITEPSEYLTTTNESPYDEKFQKSVSLIAGTEYNLKARVKWTFQGTAKTLDSSVVKFKPTQ